MEPTNKTPWQLWLAAVLGSLIAASACFDWAMIQSGDRDYRDVVDAGLLALLDAQPPWAAIAWAISVWSLALGAILLLLRRRVAWVAYLAAFVAHAVHQAYLLLPADRVSSFGGLASAALGLAIVLLLARFAHRWAGLGYLR